MKDENSEIDFSIVTASLNYGRFIEDCIRSVSCQEGVTFEHIIVDGESTDETTSILEKYPDLRCLREPDSGMSDAINKGFRMAKGRFVMWLNADDTLLPGSLKAVYDVFDQEPDLDVVYGGWNFVSESGEVIREMTVIPFQFRTLVYLGCYIGSTATFFRRETTIGQGHLLNPEFHKVMDGEFYCRLASLGKKFGYLHAILATFRLHGENSSLRDVRPEGIDQHLRLEKQFAESRAIKRHYGWKLTGIPMIDTALDTPLFYLFLIRKALCKRGYRLLHKPKTITGAGGPDEVGRTR